MSLGFDNAVESTVDQLTCAIPCSAPRKLHRIADVRRQEGASIRTVAWQLGISADSVRRQEAGDNDLLLSDLVRWEGGVGCTDH